MIMALMATDLPLPVEPAMRTWGIVARSAMTMRPLMSLPMERVSFEREAAKLSRLDDVAQPDGFALVVRHLNADGALAGHALDEDGFSAGGEAEVFGEAGDAAVFDAGVGAEFESSDDRAGIDLDDLAEDVELRAFFHQRLGCGAQIVFTDGRGIVAAMEQGAEAAGGSR